MCWIKSIKLMPLALLLLAFHCIHPASPGSAPITKSRFLRPPRAMASLSNPNLRGTKKAQDQKNALLVVPGHSLNLLKPLIASDVEKILSLPNHNNCIGEHYLIEIARKFVPLFISKENCTLYLNKFFKKKGNVFATLRDENPDSVSLGNWTSRNKAYIVKVILYMIAYVLKPRPKKVIAATPKPSTKKTKLVPVNPCHNDTPAMTDAFLDDLLAQWEREWLAEAQGGVTWLI